MPKNEWEVEAEKTYRSIGRFIFEFSQCEYTIRHFLGEEIKLDERFFGAVVESYDVAMLCTITKQVFSITRSPEMALRIEKLINEFFKLNQERIRVAHGLWNPSTDGGTVHHVSRNTLKTSSYREQSKLLDERATEANALRNNLENAFYGI
jgi:hypothetical protein